MSKRQPKHLKDLVKRRQPVSPSQIKEINGFEHLSDHEAGEVLSSLESLMRVAYRIIQNSSP